MPWIALDMMDDWTKQILSYYLSPSRTICNVLKSKSLGFGGFIGTIRFIDLNETEVFQSNSIEQQIEIITNIAGITGMHLLSGDKKFGQMKTEEKSFRSNQGKEDQVRRPPSVYHHCDWSPEVDVQV